MTPQSALQHWLDQRLDAAGSAWLREAVSSLAAGGSDRELFRCVSLVSRKLGKAPLGLDAAAALARPKLAPTGWDPSDWTIDQAARVFLLLAAVRPTATPSCVASISSAPRPTSTSSSRSIAGCRCIPISRGIRVARGRGYAHQHESRVRGRRAPQSLSEPSKLSEEAWNQMVLKALFMGSTLDPIVGLDRAPMRSWRACYGDYAHERWSAGRPVSPELWRCVGPFASGEMLPTWARARIGYRPSARRRCWPCAARRSAGNRFFCSAMPACARVSELNGERRRLEVGLLEFD
jgi:hypothetical protein